VSPERITVAFESSNTSPFRGATAFAYIALPANPSGHAPVGRTPDELPSTAGPPTMLQTESVNRSLSVNLVNTGVSDVLLFLHTNRAPSEAEWTDAMALLTSAFRTSKPQSLRSLVITDGGGPDADMRAQLKALYERERFAMPTAVLAGSVLVRGIVGAISWFSPSIRSFSPLSLDAALRALEVAPSARTRLLEAARSMQRSLPLVTCLKMIESAQS